MNRMFEFHQASAEHHVEQAQFHRRCASCYGGLIGKAGAADYFEDLKDAHEQAAASHVRMGEKHVAMCKAIEQLGTANGSTIETHDRAGDELLDGMYGGDLNKTSTGLVPTAVRMVAGDSAKSGGAVLVPRSGAAPVTDSTGIPSEFLELFDVGED